MIARFCINCRHYAVRYPANEPICTAPIFDLVSGEARQAEDPPCILMRRPDMPCGIDGRLWERPRP
jgi:hypothetical protein